MSDKRAWSEDFDCLQDFIDLLNIPDNASGMYGRTAAATIIELEAERDALKGMIIELLIERNFLRLEIGQLKAEEGSEPCPKLEGQG